MPGKIINQRVDSFLLVEIVKGAREIFLNKKKYIKLSNKMINNLIMRAFNSQSTKISRELNFCLNSILCENGVYFWCINIYKRFQDIPDYIKIKHHEILININYL